ncbi:MAG: hypothetical protein D3909_13315 [Candidatus Electrothrix sp. ATG1]|nr:hypothetical protein [Candidatus Electrothrix sp. ATG1]
MYQKGVIPDGNRSNRALMAQDDLTTHTGFSAAKTALLYDPQTSGGLLLVVAKSQAGDLLAALHKNGVKEAACIVEVIDAPVRIKVE